MAKLFITEFATQGVDALDHMIGAMPQLPVVAEQVVNIGASSAASAALNALTAFVRIHTDAICSVAFGAAPTATAAKMRLAAGSTEYFAVPRGESYKVAVITNT